MSESFVDDQQGVALGRIGIGIFNKTSQPVWNSTRTIALVMAGELYDRDALGISVLESDEQAALALYESQGEQLHLQSRSPADAELRDLYAATFEVGRRAFYTTGAPLREGFSSLASYAP